MLLPMGFQEMVEGRLSTRYKMLSSVDEEVLRPRRRRWVKKMNGRLKRFRISRAKRLNWKAFSVILWPKRNIAGIYADIVDRILKVEGLCPGIIFSSQWGLPVLSHPNAKCRRNAVWFDRKPSFNDIIFTR